jgi:hypothetical protein
MPDAPDPLAARRALEAAEAKILDATQARDEARTELDFALADSGWYRLVGAFSPKATPLYRRGVSDDDVRPLPAVIDLLEREAAAPG